MLETVPAKTIVTRAKGGWFGIDYNMNLYRGCCHGCIYCDSRSACYGIDRFDEVRVKENALELVRNDLRRKVKTGVVGTGAMSDPYNPFEREHEYTRHALELIDAYSFGVAIATKSDLIRRDIDLLQGISAHSPVLCKLTVTTVDEELCRKLEPRAPAAAQRLAAIEALARAGLFAGVLLMPVLPFLEDTTQNVLEVARRARASGARFVYPAFGVTLRQNQREWFYDRLDKQFPGEGLRERYQRRFGERYECRSPRARALWEAFSAECDRLGLLYRMEDIVRAYRMGYESPQISLY
ncbi:radical SAM protein [Clostridiaceae bacterium NSJ-31]|uniref:Radical SAM protein n=2 Tax=Ligaoa zhengdingensis TaxID=2763658 RepID=A0A926I562_9FIRM|nr:radical SAM protein [Ligaoa zhengdingensis]MBC8546951.1 radical SAM protein [Ligaoa zhengdingensis]